MKYASFVRLGETCFGVFHRGKVFDLTYQLAGGSSSLKESIHFGTIPDNTEELEGYLANVTCLLYTSPSPRDATLSRMPSSA